MKSNLSIQFKAAFLLLVFASNMAVSFACAVGVDMDFNPTHHPEKEAIKVDEHADGNKHDHYSKAIKHDHEQNKPDKKEKAGCCNDEVQNLQSLDKDINQNAKTSIGVPAFVFIVSTFLGIDIFNLAKVYPTKYKARYFHPPPADIRIAIQRFQI